MQATMRERFGDKVVPAACVCITHALASVSANTMEMCLPFMSVWGSARRPLRDS